MLIGQTMFSVRHGTEHRAERALQELAGLLQGSAGHTSHRVLRSFGMSPLGSALRDEGARRRSATSTSSSRPSGSRWRRTTSSTRARPCSASTGRCSPSSRAGRSRSSTTPSSRSRSTTAPRSDRRTHMWPFSKRSAGTATVVEVPTIDVKQAFARSKRGAKLVDVRSGAGVRNRAPQGRPEPPARTHQEGPDRDWTATTTSSSSA